MVKTNKNPMSLKAGALSVGLHVAILMAMLISFNLKTVAPISVAEVELWDSLPSPIPDPIPSPVMPKPVELPPVEVKPTPQALVEEEPKADIALEKKLERKLEKLKAAKLELEKKALETKDKEIKELKKKELVKKELEKIKQQALLDDQLEKEMNNKEAKNKATEKLDQLKKQMLVDDANATKDAQSKATASASAGEIDKYKALIQSKIQGNVNKQLCGDGNPTLEFSISLMPTGEVIGAPKLTKASGISACDEAVERAIKVSEPLPLPADSSLFAQFRNLKLKFRPNQDN